MEVVASRKQLRENVGSVSEEWDVLATKCGKLALEVQCMPGSADKARSMRALVAELEEAS